MPTIQKGRRKKTDSSNPRERRLSHPEGKEMAGVAIFCAKKGRGFHRARRKITPWNPDFCGGEKNPWLLIGGGFWKTTNSFTVPAGEKTRFSFAKMKGGSEFSIQCWGKKKRGAIRGKAGRGALKVLGKEKKRKEGYISRHYGEKRGMSTFRPKKREKLAVPSTGGGGKDAHMQGKRGEWVICQGRHQSLV